MKEDLTVRKQIEVHPAKTEYFRELSFQYFYEIRQSIRHGQLTKTEGWRNIVEHQLVQILYMTALADMLGLNDETIDRLTTNIAIHDWNKRIEKDKHNKDRFDSERASSDLVQLGADEDLIDATKPKFQTKFKQNRAEISLEELLMFYIDNITNGSSLSTLEERISEAKERNPEHDWDTEKVMSDNVQEVIANLLKKNGYILVSDDDIPDLIGSWIMEHFNKFRITTGLFEH